MCQTETNALYRLYPSWTKAIASNNVKDNDYWANTKENQRVQWSKVQGPCIYNLADVLEAAIYLASNKEPWEGFE